MSIFNEKITVKTPSSSNFDMGFTSRFTARPGVCIPHYIQDVVPGDYIKISDSLLCRTMPLVAPMLTDFKISQHFFFVPKRLLWNNFEKYITAGKDGTAESSYSDGVINNPELVMPYHTIYDIYDSTRYSRVNIEGIDQPFDDDDYDSAFAFNGSLSDFLGVPKSHYTIDPDSGSPAFQNNCVQSVQPIPTWRYDAYWLIMKSYYKDENLDYEEGFSQDLEFNNWFNDVNYNFGPHYNDYGHVGVYSSSGYFTMWNRAWKKDYFTSALPWAQRGQEAIMPLIGRDDPNVPVQGIDLLDHEFFTSPQYFTQNTEYAAFFEKEADGRILLKTRDNRDLSQIYNIEIDFKDDPFVNLENIPLFSIRELRRAESIQRLLEKLARGGARFSEMLLSVFGVRPADARVQRPDFIGGTTQRLIVDEVQQNSQTTENSALGTLAGRGISAANGYICDYNVQEHGIIMGILSIVPKASYQQGLDKNLTRGLIMPDPDGSDDVVLSDRFEEYWPDLARIGEQAIFNKELFCDDSEGTASDENDGIFGYQMRYAEMKCRNDEVHGAMAQELDYWHAGRIFEGRPQLNQDFVRCKPSNRIFAVTDENAENFVLDISFDVKMSRPMPYFGEPALIG